MRIGKREHKFAVKIAHTIALFIRDFNNVTCAGSLRHKGLRFIFCDLPAADPMVVRGRIATVQEWKGKQWQVLLLDGSLMSGFPGSANNILGNYRNYYQTSEG